MTGNELMLEERLSPIKFSLLEQLTSEEKENIASQTAVDAMTLSPEAECLSKTPHKLQARLPDRRNTIHQSHPQKTPSRSTQRLVLTSPRLAIPALFPPAIGDSIIGSPSHGRRRKRLNNAKNFSVSNYPNVIGKAESINEAVAFNSDEPSPLKRRHIGSPNNSYPIENLGMSSSFRPNSNLLTLAGYVSGQETDMLHFEINYKLESTENHSKAMQRNEKDSLIHGSSKDLVKVDNADLSILLWESPSSKRIFSRRYINAIQEKYETEVRKLEEELTTKNEYVSELLARISEAEQMHLSSQQEISQLKRQVVNLQIANESSELHSKQLADDLARSVNKLKHKDSLLYLVSEKLGSSQRRIEEDHKTTSLQIFDLQESVNDLRTNLVAKDECLTEFENEINESKKLLGMDLSINCSIKDQITSLCDERDNMRAEVGILSSMNSELTSSLRELEESKRTSEIAKEELNNKFVHLMEETRKVQDEMTAFETVHKELELEVSNRVSQIEKYAFDVAILRKENYDLEESLRLSEANALQTEKERRDLLERIDTLHKQNEEKDRIISGDTRKLSELVEELNTHKHTISNLKPSSPSQRLAESVELLNQIAGLKQQISSAQRKTDERIQEVAEQLYREYSKKHEVKVNQLKEKYEAKLEEKTKQINSRERQLESLESRLKMGEKEKTYLLHLLEKPEKRA